MVSTILVPCEIDISEKTRQFRGKTTLTRLHFLPGCKVGLPSVTVSI